MLYNNVTLTVKDEQNVDKVRELLIQQATLSRQEPGCARFELYHSKADRCVFQLIEQWEAQELLDQHREAKACKEIYFPHVIPLVERVAHPSDAVVV